MLYFRALVQGLAPLPVRDRTCGASSMRGRRGMAGRRCMRELADLDPVAAARIHANDPQRIQRALEVFHATLVADFGLAAGDTVAGHGLRFQRWALVPADRAVLHERIAAALRRHDGAGFLAEVARAAGPRTDLDERTPALRSVGYRQLWAAPGRRLPASKRP